MDNEELPADGPLPPPIIVHCQFQGGTPMSLVQLKTELRQELKLTPQLLQSMEVLQMTSQELLAYIGRMAE